MKQRKMFSLFTRLCLLSAILLISGCHFFDESESSVISDPYVAIEKTGNSYSLTRGGEPYTIKGVGLLAKTGAAAVVDDYYRTMIDLAKQSGANSLRTWSTDNAQLVLDYAQSQNMTVMMGLWVKHERHGMDYDNAALVAAQLEAFRVQVKKYKDHPALLAWGVGNEVETEFTNMKVWPAVNDIAKMIHMEDPNHPTAYVGAGFVSPLPPGIIGALTEIDILGVNCYSGLEATLSFIEVAEMDYPVIVCEWGPTGWWESSKTSWGAYIEPASSARAEVYGNRYDIINGYSSFVLGSYAFCWGEKQERTYSWFSLVLEESLLTEAANTLQYKWTGQWPQYRAPSVSLLTLQDLEGTDDITVQPNQTLSAEVTITVQEGIEAITEWQVFTETTATSIGGDVEVPPVLVNGLNMTSPTLNTLTFNAPAVSGAYRLYLKAEDGHGNVGTANIPFYVK